LTQRWSAAVSAGQGTAVGDVLGDQRTDIDSQFAVSAVWPQGTPRARTQPLQDTGTSSLCARTTTRTRIAVVSRECIDGAKGRRAVQRSSDAVSFGACELARPMTSLIARREKRSMRCWARSTSCPRALSGGRWRPLVEPLRCASPATSPVHCATARQPRSPATAVRREFNPFLLARSLPGELIGALAWAML
jgi:hypothetical protein